MKKIKIFFPLLAGILLVACNNDAKLEILANPTAPVLATPSMSTTAYNKDSAAYVLNLDSTSVAETFVVTSANYGVSTSITYSLQIDKTGDNFANAQTITSVTSDSLAVTQQQLYNVITSSPISAVTGIKTSFDVRVMATIGSSKEPVYSNVITVKIDPLPSLKPYTAIPSVNLWYIIGLGDGKWTYSKAGIGVSMFPLSLVTGNAYDSAGDGTFTYTGYFSASSGFKIVSGASSAMGTWAVQWGNNSSAGISSPVFENASSSNFQVPSSGYYTITLNSIANTLSIAATPAASIPTTTYSSMDLSGNWNGWSSSANPMSAFGTTNNHQWYATVASLGTGGIKFNYNSWATSWGGTSFPFGIGDSSGDSGDVNITNLAGSYTICFNDIDGTYYFIAN
jgi:hypothetical protein